MSVYAYVDPTAEQATELFWSLVPVVSEQAGITEPDAFRLMRRAWLDVIQDIKPHHAIDHMGDGRSAIWRVRLTIWGGEEYQSLLADTDDGRDLGAEGVTLLNGLPAVSAWVRELTAQAHPGCTLDGLSEITLAGKIKSLRVALSNQGGTSIWRLRYAATPAVVDPAPVEAGTNLLKSARAAARGPQFFMAHVRVSREESPRHRV